MCVDAMLKDHKAELLQVWTDCIPPCISLWSKAPSCSFCFKLGQQSIS